MDVSRWSCGPSGGARGWSPANETEAHPRTADYSAVATRAYRRPPDPVRPAVERDLRLALRDRLDSGLANLAASASAPHPAGVQALEVHLLVQVVRHNAYEAFRAGRAAAWRGTGFSTRPWPRRIRATDYFVLLLALPAQVRPAVGTHPQVTADPLYVRETPARPGDYRELVLGLVTSWLFLPAAAPTALVTPPEIEALGRRGVLERRVETFGRSWVPGTSTGAEGRRAQSRGLTQHPTHRSTIGIGTQ